MNIGGRDPLDIADGLAEELRTDFQGARILAADLEECQEFVDHVVGRDQGLGVTVEPVAGGGMIGVGRDEAGEPGSRIHADHGPFP
jgi:hypothetical protein